MFLLVVPTSYSTLFGLGKMNYSDTELCNIRQSFFDFKVHDNVITSEKRKRSWSRAVFSNLQRKGLEKQFEVQKYITKPDRKKLAQRLNLSDSQVDLIFNKLKPKQLENIIRAS